MFAAVLITTIATGLHFCETLYAMTQLSETSSGVSPMRCIFLSPDSLLWQDTMVGSASLLQSLAGNAEKAASVLHSLAPEVR